MSVIQIGQSQHGNWNVPHAGPDRTFTVTTTIATTGISSAGLFPPQAVGFGGFTILLGGVEYTVAYVSSTSAAVLTSPYAAAGGPTTCIWYKWLWMQIYSDNSFQPFGEPTIVSRGTPGSDAYYKRYACSLVNSAGTNYLRHPQVTISSTTDSPGPTSLARYYFGLYLVDGRTLVQAFPLLDRAQVPPTTPTSLNMLATFNQIPQQPVGNWPDYFTADEINNRFPSGFAGQIYGFQQTGNILAPFTLGAGFTVDLIGKIISTSGGGNPSVRTITFADSPAALTANDGVILMNCAAGPVTLVFPPAATLGVKLFYVIKIDSSTNAGTLDPNGVETINGAATFTLSRQFSAAIVYCTGSTFYVLGGNLLAGSDNTRLVTGPATTSITSADGTILCDCALGQVTVNVGLSATLPSQTFTIKRIDTSINNIVVQCTAPETIDGQWRPWVISAVNGSLTIQSVPGLGFKTKSRYG